MGSPNTDRTYNAFGELATYAAEYNSNNLYQYTLHLDEVGRFVGKTETLGGTTTEYEFGYDQNGRLRPNPNPYSAWQSAPRTPAEKIGNMALSKGAGKATGGVLKIDPKTGRIVPVNPLLFELGLALQPGNMAKCHSLYCDDDEDGWSDVHHDQMGMCVPGQD